MITDPALPVIYRERPFDGRAVRRVVAPGVTLAEIVATTDGLPAGFARFGIVCVNGEEVPREVWHRVRPRYREGREILVTLYVPMQGGGGGGAKTALRIAAMLAIVVAAAYAGPAVAGALGFTAGTVGFATVSAVVSATISVAGSLAIAALTPPPSLNQSAPTSSASGINPGTASLSGNVLAPGSGVPRVVGTMRVFPPLGCEPLVEVVGDDEYAEGVYLLAGPHRITGAQSGGLDVGTLSEFAIDVCDGLPGSSKVSLVKRYSKTDQPAIQLSNYTVDVANGDTTVLANQTLPDTCIPTWHRVVSRKAPADEIWLTLSWPEGLMVDDAPGVRRGAPVRIRLRQKGASSWINGPEIHFAHGATSSFKKTIKLMFMATPSVLPVPSSDEAPYIAYRGVPGQSAVAPATTGWTADAYFSTGAGQDYLKADNVATSGVRNVGLFNDRVELYLSGAQFPKGQWEVELIYGYSYNSTIFTTTTYHFNGSVKDLFGYFVNTSNGNKLSPPAAVAHVHNTCVIQRVSSIYNSHPVHSDDFAHIAVRAKNRAIGDFSVLANGYVYDWDGSNWATLSLTDNPAAHYRDVLVNPALNARPLPEEMLDQADLVAWRAMGYTVNAVCEGKNAADVLTMIAAAGYARPRQSETWGVIVDRDRSGDGPVQTFSPRNMSGFQWTKAFAQRPDGFRARFSDVDSDYQETELIVLDPNATSDSGRYEDIRYDGLVSAADVTARAVFDLGNLRYRMNFYKGTTNRQHLVVRRGDLVGVSYDVIQRNAGSAYIKAIVTDGGGNVVGLVLDGSIPLGGDDAFSDFDAAFSSYHSAFAGERTGCAIRLRNQTVMVAEVTGTGPDATQVTFATPFADPGASVLANGALVVFGPLGEEYKRMIVYDVTPKSEMTADITFVDEAPQLFAA